MKTLDAYFRLALLPWTLIGIVLSIVMLSLQFGCGEQVDCTFTIRGLCVDAHGYEMVDESLVGQTIESAEYAAERFYPDFNLSELIGEAGVTAEFVKSERFKEDLCSKMTERRCNKVAEYTQGYYQSADARNSHPSIEVIRFDGLNKWSQCYATYYILGHELLHAVVDLTIDVSNKEAITHMTPNIFIQWAIDEDKPVNTTAEFYVAMDATDLCDSMYERPAKK